MSKMVKPYLRFIDSFKKSDLQIKVCNSQRILYDKYLLKHHKPQKKLWKDDLIIGAVRAKWRNSYSSITVSIVCNPLHITPW